MSCKYMDECPFVERECRANIASYKKMEHKCIPFLVMAYENVNKELQEYKNTGLAPDQIREIDGLYAKQAKELADYKSTGLTPDQVRGQTKLLDAAEAIWD